jgi:sugar (pentulose or hexulose) kinase
MKNVIAIFDVGKTNKKLLLFDEQYKVVLERSARFNEITDEDGFPCENLESLRSSVIDSLQEVIRDDEYTIKAINFSAYGASFVFTDENGEPVAPLYNYLKPYDDKLLRQFYDTYGGETYFSQQTASPVLGNLNSGMQLYRIKYEKPELFQQIKHALHLPQYLSYIVSKKMYADLTSIGSHTNLWNFQQKDYHEWVAKEGVLEKMVPVAPSNKTVKVSFDGKQVQVGAGLHDSSAALIPYLVNFKEPFVLISTGTWCISLNPFNHSTLTEEELQHDCLCYLQYNGNPVKAARLFAGHAHDEQTKRIAAHFNADTGFYRTISFNDELIALLQKKNGGGPVSLLQTAFAERDIAAFVSKEEAYHQLMADIVAQQLFSTRFILEGKKTKRIFVDGGFSNNEIYMNLLAAAFPGMEIYATSMAQASALGAALAIHDAWNTKPIPSDVIGLKYYTTVHSTSL